MNKFTNENFNEKLLDTVCKIYKFDKRELKLKIKIFNSMFK